MRGQVIPLRRPPRESEDDPQCEELARARNQAEALVIQSLLEAHGIQVLRRTHIATSVHPFTVGHQGEVRILVPRLALPAARRLLARVARSPSSPRGALRGS